MRIIQVSPYSWDAPGGVQIHIRQLSRHLRERGHDVLVLAPGDEVTPRRDALIVGRAVPFPMNGSTGRICVSPASSRQVRRALRRFRPDVVHVHDPLLPGTSMFAVLHAKAPVVGTFHSYIAHGRWDGRLYTAAVPLLRPIWKRVAARIAVSEAARQSVCSRMGFDPMHIVPNGTDVDHFASARPADLLPGRKLLFVGRLEPRKGFPFALRAFSLLAPQYPDLRLIVVGDGVERHAVTELTPEVRERVFMAGRVTDEELPTYHRAADIFISPATGQESFGIVLVEAMAAGLPLVASDIAGYREVARNGIDGLLVEPANPEALAAGVRRLLDNPRLAGSFGASGARRALEFDWSVLVDRVEDVYLQAIGRDTAEHEVVSRWRG